MPPVLTEVLAVLFVVPAYPSAGQLVPLLFLSVTDIQIHSIVKLLQDPVVASGLFPVAGVRPLHRMEPSHGVSVIHMAFGKPELLALPFCGHSVGNGNLYSGCGFL